VRKTVTDIWFSYKNPLELQMQEEEKELQQVVEQRFKQ